MHIFAIFPLAELRNQRMQIWNGPLIECQSRFIVKLFYFTYFRYGTRLGRNGFAPCARPFIAARTCACCAMHWTIGTACADCGCGVTSSSAMRTWRPTGSRLLSWATRWAAGQRLNAGACSNFALFTERPAAGEATSELRGCAAVVHGARHWRTHWDLLEDGDKCIGRLCARPAPVAAHGVRRRGGTAPAWRHHRPNAAHSTDAGSPVLHRRRRWDEEQGRRCRQRDWRWWANGGRGHAFALRHVAPFVWQIAQFAKGASDQLPTMSWMWGGEYVYVCFFFLAA